MFNYHRIVDNPYGKISVSYEGENIEQGDLFYLNVANPTDNKNFPSGFISTTMKLNYYEALALTEHLNQFLKLNANK